MARPFSHLENEQHWFLAECEPANGYPSTTSRDTAASSLLSPRAQGHAIVQNLHAFTDRDIPTSRIWVLNYIGLARSDRNSLSQAPSSATSRLPLRRDTIGIAMQIGTEPLTTTMSPKSHPNTHAACVVPVSPRHYGQRRGRTAVKPVCRC